MSVVQEAQKLISEHIGRAGCDSLAQALADAGLLRNESNAHLWLDHATILGECPPGLFWLVQLGR